MNTRTIFVLALVLIGFLLYSAWQEDYAPPPRPSGEAATGTADQPETGRQPGAAPAPSASGDQPRDLPDVPDLQQQPEDRSRPDVPSVAEATPGRRIEVTTDVLDVEIDANGGALVDLRLKDYPVEVDQPDTPFPLLSESLPRMFVAQGGLLSAEQDAPNHTTRWQFESESYTLDEGQDELRVPLRWRSVDGSVEVLATWVFHRSDYVIDLEFEITNNGESTWRGARYVQLQRTRPDYSDSGFAFTNPERFSFNGAAVYTPEDKFIKLGYDDIEDDPFQATVTEGWAAMVQHYFLAAWIPPSERLQRYTTRHVDAYQVDRYVVAATSPQVVVEPGSTHEFSSRLYAGPKLQNRLDDIAEGLILTVDYRFFTIISRPLFWALDKIHSVIGHWGWSIVVLTLLIKLLFYKLTEKQFRSMGKMRKLQPRIQQLKERYGDDRQKFGQAMMDIYKKEKVNPLGGCLPILVQIPIFISLYWVLLESVELRQASFLWVPDLSRPDPYFILPVLNGAFMIITQRLMPTAGMDPTQRKVMQWLPVVFAFLFALFPAGLVLYWATNAGVGLAQQWYILRTLDREDARRNA